MTSGPGYPALALSYEARESAPRQVRSQIESMRQTLGSEMTDDILLIGTELATNAVSHAGTAFTFRLHFAAHGVLVTIEDRSLKVPEVRKNDPLSERGRGLLLVSRLSSQYGYSTSTRQGMKAVWALVPWPEVEERPRV